MKVAISLTHWWERALTCEAALDRHPADRLAFRELRLLARIRDQMATDLGEEESTILLGFALVKAIPN